MSEGVVVGDNMAVATACYDEEEAVSKGKDNNPLSLSLSVRGPREDEDESKKEGARPRVKQLVRKNTKVLLSFALVVCVLSVVAVVLLAGKDQSLGFLKKKKNKEEGTATRDGAGASRDGFVVDPKVEAFRMSMLQVMERNNQRNLQSTMEDVSGVLRPTAFENCTAIAWKLGPYDVWSRSTPELEIPARYEIGTNYYYGDVVMEEMPSIAAERSSGVVPPSPSMAMPSMAMPSAASDAFGGTSSPSPSPAPSPSSAGASSSDGGGVKQHSETNNQVEGVDESDIVKQDGDGYIYSVGGSQLVIIKAYPPEERGVVSRVDLNSSPTHPGKKKGRSFVAVEMLMTTKVLLIFAASQESVGERNEGFQLHKPRVIFQKYDIEDKQNCKLIWEGSVEGNFVTARLTSNIAYVALQNKITLPVTSAGAAYKSTETLVQGMSEAELLDAVSPKMTDGTVLTDAPSCECNEILYMKELSPKTIVSLMSIVMGGDAQENGVGGQQAQQILDTKTFVSPSRWQKPTIMMSLDAIYVGMYNQRSYSSAAGKIGTDTYENTVIVGYSTEGGVFRYKGSVEVPGELLNQFALDEHGGYLRVATTTDVFLDESRRWTTENMVFIIDLKTNQFVGKVFGIAHGESIYSVRFVKEKAYMVTFRQIDPLFVLDLSVPDSPRILGELKIPGYSDYLHPINETHILGIGRAGDMDGRITGIKAALFDCSNPVKPIEAYGIELGGRFSESAALSDHKAFLQIDMPRLFNSSLIVFPVTLDSESSRFETMHRFYGGCGQKYTFQGAKVFRLDGSQFTELASISHSLLPKSPSSSFLEQTLGRDASCGQCPSSKVRRVLYINEELFSLSDGYIAAHSMKTWDQVWAHVLHTPQILAAESDCPNLLDNDLVSNFTAKLNYTLFDALALAITPKGSGSLATCFNEIASAVGLCASELEITTTFNKNQTSWSQRMINRSYQYCKTRLGRSAYQSLGLYAGDCCSLETQQQQSSCLKSMESDFHSCGEVTYSSCKVWY